jgi:hypothetical protein
LVNEDAPHLVEIGRTLAALLSQPGHEVTLVPTSATTLAARRRDRNFGLMLDFARPLDAVAAPLLPLLTAVNPDLARRPPRDTGASARTVAQTLSLGVIGELHIEGAYPEGLHGLERWSLGDVYKRAREKVG